MASQEVLEDGLPFLFLASKQLIEALAAWVARVLVDLYLFLHVRTFSFEFLSLFQS
jgi:hypothetical protein